MITVADSFFNDMMVFFSDDWYLLTKVGTIRIYIWVICPSHSANSNTHCRCLVLFIWQSMLLLQ